MKEYTPTEAERRDSLAHAMSRGNILRVEFPARVSIPLYAGSGSAGACVDAFGFMTDRTERVTGLDGKTTGDIIKGQAYRHAGHYKHGRYGHDCWIPVYRLTQDGASADMVTDYRQEAVLYDGRITTTYTLSRDGRRRTVRVIHTFTPAARDMLTVRVETQGDLPFVVHLTPVAEAFSPYEEAPWQFDVQPLTDGFAVDTGTVCSRVAVRTYGDGCAPDPVRRPDGGMTWEFPCDDTPVTLTWLIGTTQTPEGAAAVAAVMDSVAATSPEAWLIACADAWHDRYGDAYVDLPDEFVARMWARSLYYVLCSFAPAGAPSAPMGWTGYGWLFHFPEDVSMIHPVLLQLGHIDIAKGMVEFYRASLECMKENTRRIYGGRGVMWAWEYPLTDKADLLLNGRPNYYQHEIHNVAYPVHMAYDTARYVKDPDWIERVVKPMVHESAEFYASHLFREVGGHWSLHVIPSMSQDEHAAPDSKNYLCALYGARYVFTIAHRLGMTEYDGYLRDGLSFDGLYDPARGMYRTSEQMTADDWGGEWYPVQMNPFVFMPLRPWDAAEMRAYEERNELCVLTKSQTYLGWTMQTYAVASGAVGRGEELYIDLHRLHHPCNLDREEITFYETSCVLPLNPYYITAHGMFLRAVCSAFLRDPALVDADAETPVPRAWRGASFRLYGPDGAVEERV